MFSRPDMGQFVRERGYLRGLAVGTVDEHQRDKIVGEGKTAELVRIERATGVVVDDSDRHHGHAESVGRRAILNSSGSTLPRASEVLPGPLWGGGPSINGVAPANSGTRGTLSIPQAPVSNSRNRDQDRTGDCTY